VGVDAERDRGACVAEVGLDHFHRAPGGDEGAGESVAEIMEPGPTRQPDPSEGAGPRLAEAVLGDRDAILFHDEHEYTGSRSKKKVGVALTGEPSKRRMALGRAGHDDQRVRRQVASAATPPPFGVGADAGRCGPGRGILAPLAPGHHSRSATRRLRADDPGGAVVRDARRLVVNEVRSGR
jgi:hypothetical protein